MSNSTLGRTSAPGGGATGLSERGKAYVERLNAKKIFVDLAHINRAGFFDAVAVHDRSQPLLVSHTGLMGVHRHWRNIDDEQVRAVAETGGVVGVIYHSAYLGDPMFRGRAATIVDHLEHLLNVGGDDVAALGSDWDGAIITPRDMRTCLELPRLVQPMLDRGWKAERIRKVLGENFLAAVTRLRG
jgi:membrane dipeptidase